MYCDSHIDYIRYRFKDIPVNIANELFTFLATLGSGVYDKGSFSVCRGCPSYDTRYSSYGIRFIHQWTSVNGMDILNGYLDITGKFFEKWLQPQQYDILKRLYSLCSKVTRIDLATDFYSYDSSLWNQIKEDSELKKFRLCRKFRKITESTLTEGKVWHDCESLYFGSRESSRYLRIYTTKNTHDFDALRFEVELKRELSVIFANEFFAHTCNLPLHRDMIFSQSMNAIQFVENVNRQECNGSVKEVELCEWYENLLSYGDSNMDRLTYSKPKSTLKATENWLFKQVSKSLAMFKVILEDRFYSFVNLLCSKGIERFDDYDVYRINEYQEFSEDKELKEEIVKNRKVGFQSLSSENSERLEVGSEAYYSQLELIIRGFSESELYEAVS